MKRICFFLGSLILCGLAQAQNIPNLQEPPNCPSSLNISTSLNADNNKVLNTVVASSTIMASNTIRAGELVEYSAGTSIILHPNFWACEGTDFHAFIEGCKDTDHVTFGETIPIELEKVTGQPTSRQVHALIVYPNPTLGIITLQGLEGVQTLTISDMTGKQLLQTTTNGYAQLDLSLIDYVAGVYFVRTDDGQIQKIIKY